jgi:hypothetical protein
MKKFVVFIACVFLVWFLVKIRGCAMKSVNAAHDALAAENAKGLKALAEQKELERAAGPTPTPTTPAVVAIDTSPFHFLAATPAGKFVRIAGPLTFRAKDPVRIALEISPDVVGLDMPSPVQKPGEQPRRDVRISNTTFEVMSNGEGAARAAPFRVFCSLAPEPAIITVDLELGGNHDALDAESKKIYAREIANEIGQVEARGQLESLHGNYVSNAKGTYEIRAVYRHGRLVTAPITVIISD